MWTQITIDDIPRLERFSEIMQAMDFKYSWINVPTLRSGNRRYEGRLFLYQSANLEIALVICRRRRTDRYHICVGFLGTATPRNVLDLCVDATLRFADEHGISAIYAVRPRQVAHPPLQELHELLPSHPDVRARSVAEMSDAIIWKLERARGALGGGADGGEAVAAGTP